MIIDLIVYLIIFYTGILIGSHYLTTGLNADVIHIPELFNKDKEGE